MKTPAKMRSLLVMFLSYFGIGAALTIANESLNQDEPVGDTRLSNSHVEKVNASPLSNNSPEGFLLLLNLFHPLRDAVREIEPLYMTPFGISSACQYATEFQLIGDQLHAGKHIVSTEPGIQSQPLLGGPLMELSAVDSSRMAMNCNGSVRILHLPRPSFVFPVQTLFLPSSIPPGYPTNAFGFALN
uniref:Uncharacterized protein n=1 Tax=Bionectria ochroleuca TaxID=29856 RepID=A0A8H7NK45_BIOOC